MTEGQLYAFNPATATFRARARHRGHADHRQGHGAVGDQARAPARRRRRQEAGVLTARGRHPEPARDLATSPTARAAPPLDRGIPSCRYRSPTGWRGRCSRRRRPTLSPSIATTGSISASRISPVFSSGPSCVHQPTCFIVKGPAYSRVRWEAFPVTTVAAQLPLAQHAGISGHLKRSGFGPEPQARRARPGAGVLSRLLREERARVVDVGPGLVGIAGDGDDLAVVLAALAGSPAFSAAFAAPT